MGALIWCCSNSGEGRYFYYYFFLFTYLILLSSKPIFGWECFEEVNCEGSQYGIKCWNYVVWFDKNQEGKN